MAQRKKEAVYTPLTKNRRRRRPRPFNHTKNLSKRSPFYTQRKQRRGQG